MGSYPRPRSRKKITVTHGPLWLSPAPRGQGGTQASGEMPRKSGRHAYSKGETPGRGGDPRRGGDPQGGAATPQEGHFCTLAPVCCTAGPRQKLRKPPSASGLLTEGHAEMAPCPDPKADISSHPRDPGSGWDLPSALSGSSAVPTLPEAGLPHP